MVLPLTGTGFGSGFRPGCWVLQVLFRALLDPPFVRSFGQGRRLGWVVGGGLQVRLLHYDQGFNRVLIRF
jgi:hypothetical protein